MKKDDSREDVLPPNVDGVEKRSEQKKKLLGGGRFWAGGEGEVGITEYNFMPLVDKTIRLPRQIIVFKSYLIYID